MKINNKGFKDWTEEDLLAIIENDAYAENEYIDYKETFAVLECQEKEAKRKKQNEFRHDICSFANADGGYLIFGIKEEAGIPSGVQGITVSNMDKFELERRNELSGIIPVVPNVEFSYIQLTNRNNVIVIQISKGVHKPYLYKENEDNYKFYVRRGNRKQAMSYMEIRDNFLHSNILSEEIKAFRKERLSFYSEEYSNTPFALIQVIPDDFLNDVTMTILFNEYKEKNIKFHDLFKELCYGHIVPNVDGVCFPNYGYNNGIFLQLFNNGITELFYVLEIKEKQNHNEIFIHGILEKMSELVNGTRDLYILKERHTAVYLCVTLFGAKGLCSDNDFFTNYYARVDRNEINCMPIEIQDITDRDLVNKAVNFCEIQINYSVGKRK